MRSSSQNGNAKLAAFIYVLACLCWFSPNIDDDVAVLKSSVNLTASVNSTSSLWVACVWVRHTSWAYAHILRNLIVVCNSVSWESEFGELECYGNSANWKSRYVNSSFEQPRFGELECYENSAHSKLWTAISLIAAVFLYEHPFTTG